MQRVVFNSADPLPKPSSVPSTRKRTPLRLRASIFLAAVLLVAVVASPASARLYVATWTATGAGGVLRGATIDGFGFGDPGEEEDIYRVDLVRAGATIATATGQYIATIPKVPVVGGDQVTVTDVTTGLARTVTMTGRPTLSDAVCGTPTTFSGTRDAGSTLWISASLDDGGSARTNVNRVRQQTFFGSGTTFSGSFTTTLSPSWSVYVSQARSFTGVTVFNDIERPVGTCPAAPGSPGTPAPVVVVRVPAAPVPPVTPSKDIILPGGRLTLPALLKRPTAAFRALLGGTFTDSVLVSEPGTVTQTLYLDDGAKLPKATAAAAKNKKKKLTVVGQGRATVKKSGAVKVTIKVSKKGRSRLRAARRVKLVLVTVVRDTAGNVRVLTPTRFTVKRVKGIK
jgi:hypothetical protein